MLAHVVHSAAPVELPALPLSVGRPGPAVGRGLEELNPHLIGPGHLQLCTGLIHTSQHRPAGGYFQRVGVAGGVGDVLHGVGQTVHRALDGALVVERTAAHLEMGAVEGGFKLAADGVGRGGSQIVEGSRRLLIASVEQGLQGGIVGKGRGFLAVVIIDLVLGLHGPGGRFLHEPPDLGFALASVTGQLLYHVLPEGFGLFIPPKLPVGRGGHGVHFGDAPGHVPQDIVLDLLPEQHQPVGCVVEIVRGQHQPPPPKLNSGSLFSSAASCASLRASSSLTPYLADRYLYRGKRPLRASSRIWLIRVSASVT